MLRTHSPRILLLVSLLFVTISCTTPVASPVHTGTAIPTPPATITVSPSPTPAPRTDSGLLNKASRPTETAIPSVSATLATAAPQAKSGLQDAALRIGDVNRSYTYYVPAHLPPDPPLVFALHGKGGNGKSMRRQTWSEFDALANQYGFIVAYPDGRDAVWVSCFPGIQSESDRAMADVAFVRAMISQFHADYGIDRSRVFAVGFSSGGFMAYRFALEMPDEIAAVAAVSASLQADATKVCRPSGRPIPILIMNGTSDPRVPYEGGRTATSNTLVLSARATAEYFATLNGQTGVPTTTRLPSRGFSDRGSVDRTVWNDRGKPEVVLFTVNGGAHEFPVWPQDLDGPAEIWDFFSRQSGSR